MGDWTRYPTDELSLALLAEACRINPDTGQTHLGDFLDMGTRVKSQTLLSDPYDDGAPVYEVEYEDGHAPHSPHTVIVSLIEEIERLRASKEETGEGE